MKMLRSRWSVLLCGLLLVSCQSGPTTKPVSENGLAPLPTPASTAAAPAIPHNFAQWEKDVAAFEAADKVQMPPKNALLFVGSSTIVRWKTLQQDYPGVPIINRGFGGNEIADSTHFADRIIFPYAPRMIFLRAGGNDLWVGRSTEEVFGDYKAFVATVREKLPRTEIVFISLSPSPLRWRQADKEKAVNVMIEEYMRGKAGFKYCDTYDMVLGADGKPREELFVADRLHFNPEGYKLLVERVRPFVPKS